MFRKRWGHGGPEQSVLAGDDMKVRTIIEEERWQPGLIGRASEAWLRRRGDYMKWMHTHDLGDYVIDEVACIFDDREEKASWVQNAVKEDGVKMFNSAWDAVRTTPINSEYAVEYDFLEADMLAGMRVEAMTVIGGNSPLHSSILNPYFNPMIDSDVFRPGSVVHFSFKVPPEEYAEVLEKLNETPCAELAQSCESTYGAFSYWRVHEISNSTFLKPRINLRDQEVGEPVQMPDRPTPPDTTGGDRGDFGMPGVGGRRAIPDNPQA